MLAVFAAAFAAVVAVIEAATAAAATAAAAAAVDEGSFLHTAGQQLPWYATALLDVALVYCTAAGLVGLVVVLVVRQCSSSNSSRSRLQTSAGTPHDRRSGGVSRRYAAASGAKCD